MNPAFYNVWKRPAAQHACAAAPLSSKAAGPSQISAIATPLRGRSYLWAAYFLVLFVALVGLPALDAKAGVKLSNLNATVDVTKDQQDTTLEIVKLTLKYDILNVDPVKGAIVDFDVRLRSTNGSLDTRPLSSELDGDFGVVAVDGSKSITWNVSKTLTRMAKEGGYDCTIDLSVEGQTNDPTRARIDIPGYSSSTWYYFEPGTITMSDLKKVSPSTVCRQADNWQSTVDAGATFYQGTVTGFPKYLGNHANPIWSGPVNKPSCSAFIATISLGTKNEKTWVNFAEEFDGNGKLPDGSFQDEQFIFQVRYERTRTTTTFVESINMGNAGKPSQVIAFSPTPTPKDYTFTLDAGKEDIQSSNTVKVLVKKKSWTMVIDGADAGIFKVTDGGYFERTNDGKLVLTDGRAITINNKMYFVGSSFSIDTTTLLTQLKRATIRGIGTLLSDNVPLVSAGPQYWQAGIDWILDPIIGTAIDITNYGLKDNLFAAKYFPTHITFEGGLNATELTLGGRILVQSATFGCESASTTPLTGIAKYKDFFGSPAGIDFDGVQWNKGLLEVSKLSLTNFGLRSIKGFCLSEFNYTYVKAKDSLGVNGKVALPKLFSAKLESVNAGFSLYQGQFDGFGFGSTFTVALEPPFAWKGFQVSASKLVTGPFTFDGTATFSHLSPADVVGFTFYPSMVKLLNYFPTLFTLDAKAHFEYPAVWDLTGDLKLFGTPSSFWLGEATITAGLDLSMARLYVKDGHLRLLNLGGTQWLFDGGIAASIQFRAPQAVTAQATGTIFIPDLFKGVPILGNLSAALGLPRSIGNSSFQMNNNLVALYGDWGDAGKNTIIVDLANYGSPGGWVIREGQNVSILSAEPRKHDHTESIDTTFHPFNATANMDRVILSIYGTPKPSHSVLVDPSGRIYSVTIADSSVIYRPAAHQDTAMIWIAVHPAPGTWKLGIIGQRPTDRFTAWAPNKPRANFTFTPAVQGRSVTTSWDASNAIDSSNIDFFLADDATGTNGRFIGASEEKTGTFTYGMTDSLPNCSYYIYGVRLADGSSYHSATILANPKASLAAPTNIQAVVDRNNVVTVTWAPSTDSQATNYLIRVTDQHGKDSVYASTSNSYTASQFTALGAASSTVSMLSINVDGQMGCWSAPVAMAAAGVRQPIAATGAREMIQLLISPNPTTANATLYVNLQSPADLMIELFDMDGRKIQSIKQGRFDAGTVTADFNANGLPNGVYVIRAVGTGISASQKIVLQR